MVPGFSAELMPKGQEKESQANAELMPKGQKKEIQAKMKCCMVMMDSMTNKGK